MNIFRRQTLWTLLMLLILGSSGHFFLNAFQNHREQNAQLERIRFREAFVRRQVSEIRHKVQVIERANRFTDGAVALGLVPDNWTRYEVNIEAPLRFQELAEILRQCRSTAYYYFQPDHLKVHLAGAATGREGEEDLPTMTTGENDAGSGDLFLQLKGTFLARRR